MIKTQVCMCFINAFYPSVFAVLRLFPARNLAARERIGIALCNVYMTTTMTTTTMDHTPYEIQSLVLYTRYENKNVDR